ncbi:metK [Mytilus coruscus]|uniref:Methionine adenosyltransferase 2 subunit beta n=1 Tax=Mytilus coruscus TaxID=42192 RepID=A0A6J8DVC8_MYTCO|nr:metK [Mytilus coruscus]
MPKYSKDQLSCTASNETARVIRVVTPPGFYDPLPVIRPPRRRIATTQQPVSAESSPPTQPAVPLPVPTSSTPVSIRGPNPTAPTPPLVSPFTPARPTHTSSHLGPIMSALAAIGSAVSSIQKNLDTLNKKVDTGLRRLTELEVMHKRLASQQDQILARQHRPTIPAAVVDDQQVPAIPDLYNLPNEELTRIKISAKSAGNFAAALTKRFFQNCTAWTTCATSTTGMVVESMPSVVIHSAAERKPDAVEQKPEATQELNVSATKVVYKNAAAVGAWVLHISTDYVFEGSSPPYKEDATPNPLNKY